MVSRTVTMQGVSQSAGSGVADCPAVAEAVAGVGGWVCIGVDAGEARGVPVGALVEAAAVGGTLVGVVGAGGAAEHAASSATTTMSTATVDRGKAVTGTAIRPPLRL